jgi:hypothetical protein
MWKAVAILMITLGVAACAPVSTTPYPTTTPVYRTPPAMLVERPSVFYTPKSVEELKLMNKKQLIDEMQGACNDAIINNQMKDSPKAQPFPEMRLKYMNQAKKAREYIERVTLVVRSKYDPEPPWTQAYLRGAWKASQQGCDEGWELAKEDWAAELPKKSEAK